MNTKRHVYPYGDDEKYYPWPPIGGNRDRGGRGK